MIEGAIPRTVAGLLDAYAAGELLPSEVVEATLARIDAHGDPAIWIGEIDATAVRDRLGASGAGGVRGVSSVGSVGSALHGIPFAVKDNIDVMGMLTTAACPGFARMADETATAVTQLAAAGAIMIGKTNLDQFATGLVGTRSPYGTPTNPFDANIVPGGSSSGSGVAVAAGLVPFALGTDTAGSGRIPAALGNIVGCKPTLGLVSTRGVLPACRSLDCVSVFTTTALDAAIVLGVLDRFDGDDIYARPLAHRRQRPAAKPADIVIGIPGEAVLALCDTAIADAFSVHAHELTALGARLHTVDLDPFLAAGNLLYDGPWLAERLAAIAPFLERHPDEIHPITRAVVREAARYSAVDAFNAEYRRRELALTAATAWLDVDAIALPSVPSLPTLVDVVADPIGVNARLGRFSTFVNLLDLCAVAVPGGLLPSGFPIGFTLVAPACSDRFLLSLAHRYQQMVDRPLGAVGKRAVPTLRRVADTADTVDPASVRLAVVGAHLSGQPLNGELVARGARLSARTTTSPHYRLVALPRTTPAKPGLTRLAEEDVAGTAIEVEVWDVPVETFGSFVAAVPPPLGIGKLELADGTWVSGFVCEPVGLDGAEDISHHGGWRNYLIARGA